MARMRRESYSNRFATALEGVDLDNPGTTLDRTGGRHRAARGRRDPPPPSGRGARRGVPARQHRPHDQDHRAGPFTMAQQARMTTTATRRSWRWLTPQPSMRRSGICSRPAPTWCSSTSPTCRPGRTRPGVRRAAVSRALEGIRGTTAVHMCFGYAAIVKAKPTGYSFLPELERLLGAADLDRGGAAEARSRGARSNSRKRPSSSA